MEKGNDMIQIYWIESHKANEEIKTFIEINGEKIEMIYIYTTNEILTDEISSVYFYVRPKIVFDLNFISEFVANKNKSIRNKISLDMRYEKDHYFL